MTAGSRILLWLIMFRVQYSMSSFPGIKVCIYKVPRQFSGEITYRCRWRQQVQRCLWWTHLSSQSWETLLTLVGVGVRRPPFDGLFLITDIVQFTLNLVNVGNKVCHEMRMRYDVIRNDLTLETENVYKWSCLMYNGRKNKHTRNINMHIVWTLNHLGYSPSKLCFSNNFKSVWFSIQVYGQRVH